MTDPLSRIADPDLPEEIEVTSVPKGDGIGRKFQKGAANPNAKKKSYRNGSGFNGGGVNWGSEGAKVVRQPEVLEMYRKPLKPVTKGFSR